MPNSDTLDDDDDFAQPWTVLRIMNTIYDGMVKQNAYSLNSMHCRYRTHDGKRCAAGMLIPDELYTPEMEGCGVSAFRSIWEKLELSNFLAFIELEQRLHDMFALHNVPFKHYLEAHQTIFGIFNDGDETKTSERFAALHYSDHAGSSFVKQVTQLRAQYIAQDARQHGSNAATIITTTNQ